MTIDPNTVKKNLARLDQLQANMPKADAGDVFIMPSIAYGNQAAFGQFPFMASLQVFDNSSSYKYVWFKLIGLKYTICMKSCRQPTAPLLY